MGSSRSATPAFSPTQPTSSPSPRQNVFLPIASPQQQQQHAGGSGAGNIVRGNRLISPGPAKWRTATSPSHYLPPASFQNVVRPELVRPGVVTTHQTASPGNHASAPTSVIRISPSPRVSLNSAQTISNSNHHQWRTEQRVDNQQQQQQQLHQQQSIILQKVSKRGSLRVCVCVYV